MLLLAVITIKQVNAVEGEDSPLINLAEVQLFSGGVQIPTSQLSFTLSSTFGSNSFPASNCNDGDLTDFCHSAAGDESPTLTIRSLMVPDEIVVTNRDGCCQARIDGATISVDIPGEELWSGSFVGSLNSYTFYPGNKNRYT